MWRKSPRKGILAAMMAALALHAGLAALPANARLFPLPTCKSRVAINYLKSTEVFPSIRTPPRSGRLPFAPRGLELFQASATRVLSGAQSFGYVLSADRKPGQDFLLNWHVEVAIAQLGEDGSQVDIAPALSRTIRRVRVPRDLEALRFIVAMPAEPGFYKYRLRFRRLDGTGLGTYEQYVRVVPELRSASLRLNGRRFFPGDEIVARVFNRGTVPIAFGEGVSVKVQEAGIWADSAFDTPPVHRISFVLLAGVLGRCETFRVPIDVPAGMYRFEKSVSSRGGDQEEILSAAFEVQR
jgi:hypothetical protein